jgi:hypothetical protein
MQGYWIKATPETSVQVASQFGTDKVASIVKNSLMEYIGSFLSSTGKNRNFVPNAFPSMSIYLTDSEKLKTNNDPTKRELQLTTLFERVKEKLPCILLDDAGIVYKNSGLGVCDSTNFVEKDTAQFWFRVVREVSTSIIVGANEQTTCSSIRDAVSVMFGDICKFTNGNILANDGDDQSSWQVVINNQPLDMGNIERLPAGTGESANNLVTFSTGTIFCRFEGFFAVQSKSTEYSINDTQWNYSLEAPETIQVGSSGIVEIKNARPYGLKIASTNQNILVLQKVTSTRFKAIARKVGKVKVQLIDDSLFEQRNKSAYMPKIVYEKEIEITL